MRLDGMLIKWNDDRGFGVIAPTQGGAEVFIHISSFPRDGQRPRIGELLSFEIDVGGDGRKRAKAVSRPVRAAALRTRERRPGAPRQRRSRLGRILPLVILAALGAYGYGEYSKRASVRATAPDSAPASGARLIGSEGAALAFKCDGRIHCSQMTSCVEATFFLRSCPGVKMDGDNDGIPCEQQWCTSPLAR
jgi:cold shock CspA family protein